MSKIVAYLTFNGKCQEAMTYYQDVLGGELTLQSVQGFPVEARCRTGEEHQIMHSSLIKGDMVLMASDMVGPSGFRPGNTIALALQCDTADEINTYFTKLAEGGQVLHPLAKQPWGALFGVLADKYGVAWMLNHELKAVS